MKASNTKQWRLNLGQQRGLVFLTLLGAGCGLLASFIIILFRWVIDSGQMWLTQSQQADQFELLSTSSRFLLPIVGALAIAFILKTLPTQTSKTGLAYVLDRLHKNKARIPFANTMVQFIVASIALISGQSVGREGPAVHLGAGVASSFAFRLSLPTSFARILLGAGAAAAVAASFNTPIAGVIFAMEVILMEYTVFGFMPIIAASVVGTYVTSVIYPHEPLLTEIEFSTQSYLELLYVIFAGFVIGGIAALFNRIIRTCLKCLHWNIFLRLGLAGMFTGILAIFIPNVMGAGYDSLIMILHSQPVLSVLIALLFAKLFATAITIGFGMPAGLIGPTFVIGAALGAILGTLLPFIIPGAQANPVFYALIGMTAMMGATLQAPLAALLAVIELTTNQNIILPAMLCIIISNLVCHYLFNQPSIFLSILQSQGLKINDEKISLQLSQQWLGELSSKQFEMLESTFTLQDVVQIKTRWIAIIGDSVKSDNYLIEKSQLLEMLADLSAHASDTFEAKSILKGAYRLELIEQDIHINQAISHLHNINLAGFILPFDNELSIVTREQLINFIAKQ
ncbi:chloride channel protein [Marinicellulosiphila megalodicopiae]|uniref:chloride channel protein n=1 Tax=Marinicellulosiphila megalodicopiae TaxID=2724896 RepID=UPI003BB15049